MLKIDIGDQGKFHTAETERGLLPPWVYQYLALSLR